MKIVAKTICGYLVEISSSELDDITGCGNRHDNRLQVGSVFDVRNSFQHLESIRYATEQRQKMSAQLRAMAEMIEVIPDAMALPKPPQTDGTEVAQ